MRKRPRRFRVTYMYEDIGQAHSGVQKEVGNLDLGSLIKQLAEETDKLCKSLLQGNSNASDLTHTL